MHGGRLTMKSKRGVGTTATIEFPKECVAAPGQARTG
jgi:signal transduction histidine kinase